MAPAITIHGTEVPNLTYNGQRVITLAMVDKVHHRVEGTARKRFNDHKHRLVEGEDYFVVERASEIRTLGFFRAQGGGQQRFILLTQSGYLMLVKSFTDDLAWQVQRQMVNVYFAAQELAKQAEPQLLAAPELSATALAELRIAFRSNRKHGKLLRYFQYEGMTVAEMSDLTGYTADTIRKKRRAAEALGLVAPPKDIERRRAHAAKHLSPGF